MKTLWCKNQEIPSDRISHTWAPLKTGSSLAPSKGQLFLLYVLLQWHGPGLLLELHPAAVLSRPVRSGAGRCRGVLPPWSTQNTHRSVTVIVLSSAFKNTFLSAGGVLAIFFFFFFFRKFIIYLVYLVDRGHSIFINAFWEHFFQDLRKILILIIKRFRVLITA